MSRYYLITRGAADGFSGTDPAGESRAQLIQTAYTVSGS